MAVDGAQEARAHATGAETWGTAADGAREARVHVMGAETWGTAVDGAWEVRAHTMGAETWAWPQMGSGTGLRHGGCRGVARGPV